MNLKSLDGRSTQRKLLMFETESTEDTFLHQPYIVVFGVFAFCVLIVCIALCGKVEKKYVLTVENFW